MPEPFRQESRATPGLPLGLPEVTAADAGAISIEHGVRMLGLQLDREIFPEVFDGGVVAPSPAAVPQYLGAETQNVGTRPFPITSGASSFSSGTASATSSEATAWTPSATTPLERASIRAHYEDALDDVHAAYPGTRTWHDHDGMWLLSESSIVQGLNRAATFLVAFSWEHAAAKGWGFWRNRIGSVRWIGPRHTNFPDGSICAFHPAAGTWVFGDPIGALLDLYTVWALRHLHLELFNHWPGPQAVFHPYERRMELHASERCGCGSGRTYRDCCASQDAARKVVPDAVSFAIQFAGGRREPPARVAQFALNLAQPPPICTVMWQ